MKPCAVFSKSLVNVLSYFHNLKVKKKEEKIVTLKSHCLLFFMLGFVVVVLFLVTEYTILWIFPHQ